MQTNKVIAAAQGVLKEYRIEGDIIHVHVCMGHNSTNMRHIIIIACASD